jgi:hypothetical protein
MTLHVGSLARRIAALVAVLAPASAASAQVFQFAPDQIPSGPPFNNSSTEAVDFADVDLDGDFDCVFADGGDCCNDQNRLWINLGGMQGGSIGFFADETAARCPAVLDDSRDMDFADFDADGDQDLYTCNVSDLSPQTSRFWINMGGIQGGSAGFFQDQTAARWVNLGQNNGTTTFSSLPPAQVLASGGFVDWSCDALLGDLDRDGDLDLVSTSVGGAFSTHPVRMFLNDGDGAFEEFNPSGFQLTAGFPDNSPGLWCEGLHVDGTQNSTGQFCDIADTPVGAELGDLDADFDLEFQNGARNETPRLFLNRWAEKGGALGFRDVTFEHFTQFASAQGGHYEQELGDLDLDGDLDLFGINWATTFTDVVTFNDGAGVFGPFAPLAGSGSDDSEGEIFDYDNDGDLDLFVANFSGQDRMYRNDGALSGWTFTNVTAGTLPVDNANGLQADACDVDADGDYDVMVTNNFGQPNFLLENLGQVADVHAPRLPSLEQAPNRTPSSEPTTFAAQVFDNATWTVTQFNGGAVEYRVDGGPIDHGSLAYAGANLFRGEIPGLLSGVIRYRARSEDGYGNSGVSMWRAYSSSSSPADIFCSSKPSSIPGCVPALVGHSSLVSKGGSMGTYGVVAAPVPGASFQPGILIYTRSGLLATPLQTIFGELCISQFARLGSFPASPGGTSGSCDGAYYWNFGSIIQATPAIQPGDSLHIQAWYRDTPNPGAANLTQGVGPIAVFP